MANKAKEISTSAFFEEQRDDFIKFLKKSVTLEEEHIHKLRVSVKNIRALILLQEKADKKYEGNKLLDIFVDLFNTAGKLRTIHINQGILTDQDQDSLSPYLNYLSEKERRYENRLKTTLKEYNLSKFKKLSSDIEKRISGVPKKKLIAEANKLIRNHKKKINGLIFKSNFSENLHDIRKHMKVIKAVLKTQLLLESSDKIKSQLKKLNSIEEGIGRWHDYYVLLKDLKLFMRKNDNEKEVLQIIPVFTKLKKDFYQMEFQIKNRLRRNWTANTK